MKKFLLLIILHILFLNEGAIGQEKNTSIRKLSAVNAYISLGYIHRDFNTLNSYSTDNNMPVFSNDGLNLGFGGNIFFDRLLLGGEGIVGLSIHGDSNYSHSQINSGSAILNVGYFIQDKNQLIFYPSIGLGVRGTELQENPIDNIDDQIVDMSEFRVTSINLLANLSLNTDFFLNP